MLKYIQDSAKIPKGRNHQCDMIGDSAQLVTESSRVFDMLDSVRTKRGFRCTVLKRQATDIINHNAVGSVCVIHDIDVDPSTVSSTAADMQIPLLAAVSDDRAHDAIAEEIEDWQDYECCCNGDEYGREHD